MKYDLDNIYNDDCYQAIKDVPDKSIDCVYIDIPYLFTFGGISNTAIGKRYHKREVELKGYDRALIDNNDKSKHNCFRIDKYNAEKRLDVVSIDSGIDYSIFDELCRVMKKINIFIWCLKLQILDILKYFVDKKHCYYDILVWAKTNAIPTNNSFLSNLEYCLYFRENNVSFNGDYLSKSKWYISSVNKIDKKRFKHPTIKPLELVERHIKLATNENDVVLDCFSGSGTTAVACIDLKRHYLCFEINKDYYKNSINRINNVAANGQTSFLIK